jgi:cytoskeletal protein CcmA (bactofilin family)
MFGSKKKGAIEVAKLSSLIADNLHIVGDVHFSGGLRVDGQIEGNVIGKSGGKGLVVLSEKGSISGTVRAYDAVINGTITGDIDVEHFLELQSNANVTGNLRYRQLQMDCGATVDGKLMRVHDDEPAQGRKAVAEAVVTPAEPVAAVPAPAPAAVMRAAGGRIEPASTALPGIEPRATNSEPRGGRGNSARDGVEPVETPAKERSAAGSRA